MENFESQSYQNDPMGQPNFVKEKLPNATAVLVLGILSILGCCCYGLPGLIFGAIALVLAGKDQKLYRANPDAYDNYSNLNTGKILSIIGIILSILTVVYFIFIIAYFGLETLTNQELMQERMNEIMRQNQ